MRFSRRAALAGMALGLIPVVVDAQGRKRVSYDVEFSTLGSLLDRNCSATGTDVLTGTLVGLERAGADNEYVGNLRRVTRLTTCGTKTKPGTSEDVVCSINYQGDDNVDVLFTVRAGGEGAWLEYITNRAAWQHLLPPPPLQTLNNSVTGTCEPAELSQLENDYHDGQTAGSPSGQPIDILTMPSSVPDSVTFPANPPRIIWTLKVRARRP